MPFITRSKSSLRNARGCPARGRAAQSKGFQTFGFGAPFRTISDQRAGRTYSVRKASVGDTDAARLAGITAAMNAHTIIAPAADASATGSQLETP